MESDHRGRSGEFIEGCEFTRRRMCKEPRLLASRTAGLTKTDGVEDRSSNTLTTLRDRYQKYFRQKG